MSILQIVDLKKDYGEEPNIIHALNGIQFEVDRGEFVGIMGASGSGKTTLLNFMLYSRNYTFDTKSGF